MSDLDWAEVRAPDAWWAAKLAADSWDREDRMMLRSGSYEVFEVRDDLGVVTLWQIHGEAQPVYYARQISACEK